MLQAWLSAVGQLKAETAGPESETGLYVVTASR
jgi:hypothetical protein